MRPVCFIWYEVSVCMADGSYTHLGKYDRLHIAAERVKDFQLRFSAAGTGVVSARTVNDRGVEVYEGDVATIEREKGPAAAAGPAG